MFPVGLARASAAQGSPGAAWQLTVGHRFARRGPCHRVCEKNMWGFAAGDALATAVSTRLIEYSCGIHRSVVFQSRTSDLLPAGPQQNRNPRASWSSRHRQRRNYRAFGFATPPKGTKKEPTPPYAVVIASCLLSAYIWTGRKNTSSLPTRNQKIHSVLLLLPGTIPSNQMQTVRDDRMSCLGPMPF